MLLEPAVTARRHPAVACRVREGTTLDCEPPRRDWRACPPERPSLPDDL